MKKLCVILPVILFVGLTTIAFAGTLENSDGKPYKYEVRYVSRIVNGTINGRAFLYGMCRYGCEITLLETGESIDMGHDDHVVISNGVMKYR